MQRHMRIGMARDIRSSPTVSDITPSMPRMKSTPASRALAPELSMLWDEAGDSAQWGFFMGVPERLCSQLMIITVGRDRHPGPPDQATCPAYVVEVGAGVDKLF